MEQSSLLNLYIGDKLKEDQYTERLNTISGRYGYTVYATGWLHIQDHVQRQHARLDYRGKGFVVNTTSSTYSVTEANEFLQELQSAIEAAEQLNEVLEEIKEEIYHRYNDEYGIEME